MNSAKLFGFWALVMLVVGNAVGAGIYTTSGFSLAALGSPAWVVLAWLVAGLVALSGALSYGMLVSRFQESGGEFLFLTRSVHPLAGFIAGWISLLAGFPGAVAFSALTLEAYVFSALGNSAANTSGVLASIVVILAAVLHSFRVKTGAAVHQWITAAMILVLLLVCAFGFSQFFAQGSVFELSSNTSFSVLVFANTLVWISLSYSGFNAAAYVAGEVPDAARVIPKAMVVGTLITLFLCVSVNALMVYSAPVSELQGRADIATLAAGRLAGSQGTGFIQWVIAVSLLTSITAMALAGPRVYAKMASEGALPKFFQAQHNQPPRAAIFLQAGGSLLLIYLADLRELLSYLGLSLSLCLALAVSGLFVEHWRHQQRPASPWYPLAPLVFVLSTVLFAILSAVNEVNQLLALLPVLLAGTAAWWWFQRKQL